MAKKKKNSLSKILDITSDVTGGLTKIIPDAKQVYDIGKDIAVTSSDAIILNSKKDQIKGLLIEIGNRIYEKKIEVNDRNVKAEVECIEELLKQKE